MYNIIISIFKGFLARATKICSEKHLRAETDYLTDMFCKSKYDRKILQKIITTNNNNNNNTDKKNNYLILDTKNRTKNKTGNTKVWI